MSTEKICRIYEGSAVRQVTGDSIRPGGFTLTDRAVHFCSFPDHARILDVGCGTGATVEYLMANYQFKASGVDPSTVLLELGHQRNRDLPLSQATGENLPLDNGTMDGIFAECTLSLMDNLDRTLQEFYRVLRERGWLVVTDVYARNPAGALALRDLPVASCLTGAHVLTQLIGQLNLTGFDIVLWEDHTEVLKELVFNLIMQYGSLENFWQKNSSEIDAGAIEAVVAKARPGYFLLVARKIPGGHLEGRQ